MNLPTIDVNKLFGSFALENGSARTVGAGFRIPHSCHIPIRKYGEVICGYRLIRLVREGATIHVERVNDSMVAISGSWYVDEYETFTRYSMLGPRHDFILGNTDLRKELDACLTEVIDWQKQDLVPNPGYKKIWSRYSKEDWSEIFSTSKLPRLSL